MYMLKLGTVKLWMTKKRSRRVRYVSSEVEQDHSDGKRIQGSA
jgi:hypothetical protein